MTIDRRPLYWMNWATMPRTPSNPMGYTRGVPYDYLNDPLTFITEELQRGSRYVARMHSPSMEPRPDLSAGWLRAVPSAGFDAMDVERREILIHCVNERKRDDPDFTFGLYLGTRFSDHRTIDMATATHTPNVKNAADMKLVIATLEPWKATLGLYEICLDAASVATDFGAAIALAGWIDDNLEIRVSIEAYPMVHKPDGWHMGNYVLPMMAMSNFILERGVIDKLDFDPDTTEVHALQAPHGPFTDEEAEGLSEHGVIIGSTRRRYDELAARLMGDAG